MFPSINRLKKSFWVRTFTCPSATLWRGPVLWTFRCGGWGTWKDIEGMLDLDSTARKDGTLTHISRHGPLARCRANRSRIFRGGAAAMLLRRAACGDAHGLQKRLRIWYIMIYALIFLSEQTSHLVTIHIYDTFTHSLCLSIAFRDLPGVNWFPQSFDPKFYGPNPIAWWSNFHLWW